MPNLIAHVDLALKASEALAYPDVEQFKGAYILGATAPDIRIITRSRRSETHFAPLDSTEVLAGVKGLFQAHPGLADAGHLAAPTRAFVIGYLCHLVTDQLWITELYRPFFGNPKVFPDGAAGNVLDRALQLEMDCQGLPSLKKIQPLLQRAETGVTVDFIDSTTLKAWREWLEESLTREFTWERLRSLAKRQDVRNHPRAMEVAEEFLLSVPEGLERLYRQVPREKVVVYQRLCTEELCKVVRGYLACV